MSEQEPNLSDLFDERQHKHFAEKIGEYMMGVILDETVAEINDRSIDMDCGFNTAIDRWGAAMRLLSWPRTGIPGAEDLSPAEETRVRQKSDKRPGVRELAEDIKKDRILRNPLRGFFDFTRVNSGHVDELLNNGAIDTAQWILVMHFSGVDFDSIRTHPLFLVATGFTTDGHKAFNGAVNARSLLTPDKRIPGTRREALQLIDQTTPEMMAKGLARGKAVNLKAVKDRGFCPAGRMRDEQGSTWVHLLVSQGVDLLEAMPPKIADIKK